MNGEFTLNQSGAYLIEYGAQAIVGTSNTVFSFALGQINGGTLTVIPNTSFTSNIKLIKPSNSSNNIAVGTATVILSLQAGTTIAVFNNSRKLTLPIQLAYFPNDATASDIDVAAYLNITRVGDMFP